MRPEDLDSPLLRPTVAAICETKPDVRAWLTASRGPWYGFNGLWVLAAGADALWIGRQEHAPFLAEPEITRIAYRDLQWHSSGTTTIEITEIGTFRSRTAEELASFVTALPGGK